MGAVLGQPEAIVLDRYVVHGEIAAGGMATVHLGLQREGPGAPRPVAIKRLHPQYAKDPEFCAMFLDEARLAARIRHPNVVSMLDVAAAGGELFVVMGYVHGEPLSALIRAAVRAGGLVPPPIAAAIMASVLHGLHAAHEARAEDGSPLRLVHRDVSPQNILVDADGVARVIDFGVAKAAGRSHTTLDGQIKGKFAYMPPEQLQGQRLDRTADIYAAGIVLWEVLTGRRLFVGSGDSPDLSRLLDPEVDPPSLYVPALPPALDRAVLRALEAERAARFSTAQEMAAALTASVTPASQVEVARWVNALVGDRLAERTRRIAAMNEGLVAAGARGSAAALEVDDEERTRLRPVPPRFDRTPHESDFDPVMSQEPAAAAVEGTRPFDSTVLAPHLSEPTTQVMCPTGARSRRSRLVMAGAFALAGGGVLAALLGGRAGRPEPAGAAAQTDGSAAQADGPAAAQADGPAAAQAAPPAAFAAPGSAAAPSASSAEAVGPVADGRVVATAPVRPARTLEPRRRPACDPPFTIDDKGHKRYKRECF